MKIVITGGRGTVGRALTARLEILGHQVVHWDRERVSIHDYSQMEAFLRHEAPDLLYHLAIASGPGVGSSWQVNYEWPSEVAWLCRVLNIQLVFTSTVLVFSDDNPGPFELNTPTNASQGYGYEKRMAEQRVLYQNPAARILRLGWQMASACVGNSMFDFLVKQMQRDAVIRASRLWYPACSWLEDSVSSLLQMAELAPDVYMADANRGWSFYQIVCALNHKTDAGWRVEPTDDYQFNQRMLDPRLVLPALSQHLPLESLPA